MILRRPRQKGFPNTMTFKMPHCLMSKDITSIIRSIPGTTFDLIAERSCLDVPLLSDVCFYPQRVWSLQNQEDFSTRQTNSVRSVEP